MTDYLTHSGVFEITDHTTASDWERFIANLEEFLTEWDLKGQSDKSAYYELEKGFISRGVWHEKREVLKFGNSSFDLRFQYLDDSNQIEKEIEIDKLSIQRSEDKLQFDINERSEISSSGHDIPSSATIPKIKEKDHGEHELPDQLPEVLRDIYSSSNDFASKAHCLVRWYNLRKFLILAPRGDTIISEDKVKLVLSSASMALANVDCHVPIFLQIHNPKHNFYQGISEHFNIRTMYDMVFFKQNLKQYSYLSDLISIFREKISCTLSDPIDVSIRLNYCLSTFELFLEPGEEFQGIEHEDELIRMTTEKKPKPKPSSNVRDLRSGASYEQVVEALEDCIPHSYKILRYLHVAALWPPVSDKIITDSQVHTDLDPSEAPIWTIRLVTSDSCNMKIVHETKAIYDVFKLAIDYAYDKLDGSQSFNGDDRESLALKCLKLSYDLANQPEVVVSQDPSDNLRKLIALLYYRATELYGDIDALDQLASQLRKRPSLNEVYREFRRQKPSVKEFIIKSKISRPFIPVTTAALPQRMFCTVCDEEFRLCGAFSELCN